jgi:hypothetical protein
MSIIQNEHGIFDTELLSVPILNQSIEHVKVVREIHNARRITVRKSNWYGTRKRAFWWNEPSFFHMMYPATRNLALTAALTFESIQPIMRMRHALQRVMQAPTKLTRRLFCLNGFAGTQGEYSGRIVKHRIMAGNSARLLVAALLCLSGCTQLAEPLISAGLEEDEQIKQPEGEACAKVKELKIGMTASQVILACERRPLRTSDIITRDGKKIAVWSYGSSYLHLADDKLIQIYGP